MTLPAVILTGVLLRPSGASADGDCGSELDGMLAVFPLGSPIAELLDRPSSARSAIERIERRLAPLRGELYLRLSL